MTKSEQKKKNQTQHLNSQHYVSRSKPRTNPKKKWSSVFSLVFRLEPIKEGHIAEILMGKLEDRTHKGKEIGTSEAVYV